MIASFDKRNSSSKFYEFTTDSEYLEHSSQSTVSPLFSTTNYVPFDDYLLDFSTESSILNLITSDNDNFLDETSKPDLQKSNSQNFSIVNDVEIDTYFENSTVLLGGQL